MADDMVNHPRHYNTIPGVECIDVVEHFDFVTGSILKYVWRAGLKGDALEDLEKARWYLDRKIERLRHGRAEGGGGWVMTRDEVRALESAIRCSSGTALDDLARRMGQRRLHFSWGKEKDLALMVRLLYLLQHNPEALERAIAEQAAASEQGALG